MKNYRQIDYLNSCVLYQHLCKIKPEEFGVGFIHKEDHPPAAFPALLIGKLCQAISKLHQDLDMEIKVMT